MSIRTEEDYAEAIRNVWRTHGLRLVLLLMFGGAGWAGWFFWQSQITAEQEAVADLYYEIHEVLTRESEYKSNNEPNKPEPAVETANTIKENHANSVYAVFSALYLARVYVDQSDLAAAVTEVEWALSKAKEPFLRDLARIRLAQLHIAMENEQAALDLLETLEEEALQVRATELKGDALLQMGETDAATTAYLMANAEPPGKGQTFYLDWKIAKWPSVKILSDEEAKERADNRKFKITPVEPEPAATDASDTQ